MSRYFLMWRSQQGRNCCQKSPVQYYLCQNLRSERLNTCVYPVFRQFKTSFHTLVLLHKYLCLFLQFKCYITELLRNKYTWLKYLFRLTITSFISTQSYLMVWFISETCEREDICWMQNLGERLLKHAYAVHGCLLDNRGIVVRFPAGTRNLLLLRRA
jgi:hypothetical protein